MASIKGRIMIQRIGVLGIGRLGLCLSLNLAKSGFHVMGYDIREDHVEAIRAKTFRSIEPEVENLINANSRMTPTSDLAKTLNACQALFVTVRTESRPDGSYDHSQVESLLNGILACGTQNECKTLIINCNVNPGYSNQIHERLQSYNYKVSYNPEWVAQGSIVRDQVYPDLVVIGQADKEEGDRIESIYLRMCKSSPAIHRMNRLSAEITKVALNCYLTTKITYANMVGDIARQGGVDPDPILAAIASDGRIATKYFSYGFGYGGPCFPRDTKAMIHYANSLGIDPLLCDATDTYNKKHLQYQLDFFERNTPKDQRLVIDSVTYKKGTDIILESQQLQFAVGLAKRGYDVIIKDIPFVNSQVKNIYGNLFSYENSEDNTSIASADVKDVSSVKRQRKNLQRSF